MLRDAWLLGKSDLVYMLRRKETLLWTFLMPIVFFYFIGTVTGGSGMGPAGPATLAVRVADDAGFLADEIVGRLEEGDFELVHIDSDGSADSLFQQYGRRLQIPSGFTADVLAGEQGLVTFQRDKSGLSTDYDRFRVGRAVYTVLADVIAAAGVLDQEKGGALVLEPEDFESLRNAPRALTLDVRQAGKRKRIPTGFEQAVPGTMVMFTLLVLLTSGATTLVIERRLGLLRRLASAPMRRGSVVLGKWGGKFALGMLQVVFAMLMGRFVFDVHWGPNVPMLLLTLASYAAFLASLGMLLGNLAKSEGQDVALGVLCASVLGALGGCWRPIEVTPRFMQDLALYLPTGWMMDAVHRLVIFQQGAASALPHFIGMTIGAWLLGMLCARTFRFT